MKKTFLILFILILLSSCQLYEVVILDKVPPRTLRPHPIQDSNSTATKIQFIKDGNIIWVRDKFDGVDYEKGDTIVCYFK